jgi:hypothetical protein
VEEELPTCTGYETMMKVFFLKKCKLNNAENPGHKPPQGRGESPKAGIGQVKPPAK